MGISCQLIIIICRSCCITVSGYIRFSSRQLL